jgi:hypothetical protein
MFIVVGGFFWIVPGIPKKFANRVVMSGIVLAFVSALGPELFSKLFQIFSGLPWWLLLFTVGLITISVLQAFVAIFIGWRAANTFAGNLTTSFFKAVFAAFIAPFKFVKRLFDDGE